MRCIVNKVDGNLERASLRCIIGWTALLLHFTKNTEWYGIISAKPLFRLEESLDRMLTKLVETTYA